MARISFTPIVTVEYGDDGAITKVDFDWGESVNYGDDAVEEAADNGTLDKLTQEMDEFVNDHNWKWSF